MQEPASSNHPRIFVTQLDPARTDTLRKDLEEQGFDFSKPPYTIFSAKKPGINCTLYESGKLVVQGKELAQFVEFYLEPQILLQCTHTYGHLLADQTPRIGVDESGKGDFFGPLCIAALYAGDKEVALLSQMGVRDSKTLNDRSIQKLAKQLREKFVHHVICIKPKRYNELYDGLRNLNTLLAWGHATAIEQVVQKSGCKKVVIDQFAAPHVVEKALSKKSIEIDLTQQHRAEADPVVAAASILARDAFVSGLKNLSESCGLELPKGASSLTLKAGTVLATKHGLSYLDDFCKRHFKTYREIDLLLKQDTLDFEGQEI